MTIKFAIADICSAFEDETIGSKVTRPGPFIIALRQAVENYDTSNDRVEGQHFVKLPESVNGSVSCGVGRRTDDPEDYVIRTYREGPAMFLRREKAAETEHCAVVLYTRQAYLDDPDITPEEAERIEAEDPGYTHVIVAVLAGAGPAPVVGPYRFVHNLAGGNHEYDLAAIVEKHVDEGRKAAYVWKDEFEKLVIKARGTKAYADEWKTVAD